jgi:hypothetical protein
MAVLPAAGMGRPCSVASRCGRSAVSSVRTDSQSDRAGSYVEVEPHGHLSFR